MHTPLSRQNSISHLPITARVNLNESSLAAETPPPPSKTRLAFAPRDTAFPQIVGYELLSILGTGGMGIVYEAKHIELNRRVAIKTLRGEALADPLFRDRFRAEAEAIAKLQHPNVIQVFEVGTIVPQLGEYVASPFLALEFVDGGSLMQRTYTPQDPRASAAMVETLARAVHVVHQLGIIHRDLKPSNVLLTQDGTPKIADFGIAKQLDTEPTASGRLATLAGTVVGTPEYMAPEQLEGAEATPAVDIYSLGVILYQLLTARVPFQGPTFCETAMMALRQEPTPPRRLQPRIPRDIETICLKCLEKDPQKRYLTAAMLADDLERWQKGLPISARPVGYVGYSTRWAKRNPSIAFLVAAVFVVGFTGLAGVLWNWKEARKNADIALNNAKESQENAEKERRERHRVSMSAAANALRLHDVNAARQALESSGLKGWVWSVLYAQLDKAQHIIPLDTRLQSTRFTPDRKWVLIQCHESQYYILNTHTQKKYGPYKSKDNERWFGPSPDGSTYVVTNDLDKTVQVFDSLTGKCVHHFVAQETYHHVIYNTNGRLITCFAESGNVAMWDVIDKKIVSAFLYHGEKPRRISVSRDGNYVVMLTGSLFAPIVKVWNLRTQTLLSELKGMSRDPFQMIFSPDCSRLVTAYGYPDMRLHLWDTKTGKLLSTLKGHTNQLHWVEFSPDGNQLVTTGMDRMVCLWDVSSKQLPLEMKPKSEMDGHSGTVYHATFSPDGRRIVSSSHDCTLRYWNAETGKLISVLEGHTTEVLQAEFIQGQDIMLSVSPEHSPDQSFRIWSVSACENNYAVRGHTNFVYSVAVHPKGHQFASTAWDGTARIWDMKTQKEILKLDHQPNPIVVCAAYHPSGTQLATLSRDGGARIWDANTGKLIHQWATPEGGCFDSRLAFSPDGKLLVAGSHTGFTQFWDMQSYQPLKWTIKQPSSIHELAFSPDSRFLAVTTAFKEEAIWLWDIEKQILVKKFAQPVSGARSVVWHPRGKTFAAGTEDGAVVIYNATTGEASKVMKHSGIVHGMAFHPDGKILATGCSDTLIRFWDVETQTLLAEIKGHASYVHCLAFTPDGTALISASGDTTLRVWDTLKQAERMKK